MKRFHVTIRSIEIWSGEVEAETAEEAMEKVEPDMGTSFEDREDEREAQELPSK